MAKFIVSPVYCGDMYAKDNFECNYFAIDIGKKEQEKYVSMINVTYSHVGHLTDFESINFLSDTTPLCAAFGQLKEYKEVLKDRVPVLLDIPDDVLHEHSPEDQLCDFFVSFNAFGWIKWTAKGKYCKTLFESTHINTKELEEFFRQFKEI